MKHKGDWVQIEAVVLPPGRRADNLPPATGKCPYIMRLNGYLLEDAAEGTACAIRTLAGRKVPGSLLAGECSYGHSYGSVIKELIDVRVELRRLAGVEAPEDRPRQASINRI
jgi:2-amino-4-ketopentanoate thiolase alpha subunit